MFYLKPIKQQPEAANNLPSSGDPYGNNDPEQPAERPEHIPEKFWNSEKGDIRLDDVFKSYGELEAKIGQKKEDFMGELKADLYKDRPDEAKAYLLEQEKIGVPDEFMPTDDDPLVDWWKDTAYNAGLNNDQFNEGIKMYLDNAVKTAPNPEKVKEELGENGPERVTAVDSWLAANLGEAEYKRASQTITTAADIEVFEKLMELKGQPAMGGSIAPAEPELTREMIETKMKDPRYWHTGKRDDAYCQEIANDWRKLAAMGKSG